MAYRRMDPLLFKFDRLMGKNVALMYAMSNGVLIEANTPVFHQSIFYAARHFISETESTLTGNFSQSSPALRLA